ncbi:hypothetical protein GCM10009775_12710 [Microbacterium aoyamense]|uniref:Uncharacterized protein n=1 Tax=Microbacterium aoyamense TaxID=344166 RepID=A0ABN2PIB7_9MICO
MRAQILVDRIAAEIERGQGFGTDESVARAPPRLAHKRADIQQSLILIVPREQLFVRALDQQTRGLGRDIAAR